MKICLIILGCVFATSCSTTKEFRFQTESASRIYITSFRGVHPEPSTGLVGKGGSKRTFYYYPIKIEEFIVIEWYELADPRKNTKKVILNSQQVGFRKVERRGLSWTFEFTNDKEWVVTSERLEN